MCGDYDATVTDDETQAVMHVAKTLAPEGNLSPWATKLNKQERTAFATMKAISAMQKKLIDIRKGDDKEATALDMLMCFNHAFVDAYCNYSPAVDGFRSKQLTGFVTSQKTGVTPIPPKVSLKEKIMGRGKDKEIATR